MLPPVRIFRISNVLKERVAAHVEEVLEVIANARRVLNDHDPPDTFAGHKTREPFPEEDKL